MTTVLAYVPTINGGQYVQQLCRHWSHNQHVEMDDHCGLVRHHGRVATAAADQDGISLMIICDDDILVERMKADIERQLDLFAAREAPLLFKWH